MNSGTPSWVRVLKIRGRERDLVRKRKRNMAKGTGMKNISQSQERTLRVTVGLRMTPPV